MLLRRGGGPFGVTAARETRKPGNVVASSLAKSRAPGFAGEAHRMTGLTNPNRWRSSSPGTLSGSVFKDA